MLKPMLAADTDGENLRYPILVSEKLDGVRAMVVGGELLSRSFKLIPNVHVQSFYGRKEFEGLDGELIAGDPCAEDCFRKTMSNVMTENEAPNGIVFHIFDDRSKEGQPFQVRLESARKRIAGIPGFKFVTHSRMDSKTSLEFYEQITVEAGYEGVMLRDPKGPYKSGRSTLNEGWLLKLKRFADGEAEILGYVEQMHNANVAKKDELGRTKRQTLQENLVGAGKLGAIMVKDLKSGVEFSIGTGFTDELRKAIWGKPYPKGTIIKYKFFPTGSKDRPRFPVFVGQRDRRDM